jgi:hypothetical protein
LRRNDAGDGDLVEKDLAWMCRFASLESAVRISVLLAAGEKFALVSGCEPSLDGETT